MEEQAQLGHKVNCGKKSALLRELREQQSGRGRPVQVPPLQMENAADTQPGKDSYARHQHLPNALWKKLILQVLVQFLTFSKKASQVSKLW